MKTPITYYGGKQGMVRHILPLIPPHVTYVEPFVGGGAVFWAKEPSKLETINDLNGDVVNFYRVLKTRARALKKMISGTLHSRLEYKRSRGILKSKNASELKRAWAFWVMTQQGFNSKIDTWGFGVSGTQTVLSTKNKREFFEKNWQKYAERLSAVQVECNDALYLIKVYDRPTTFFYIDPPYIGTNCGHYNGYSVADFQNLIEVLRGLSGKFLLSCGDKGAELIRQNGMEWREKQFQRRLCASKDNRRPRTEYLWANYDIDGLELSFYASIDGTMRGGNSQGLFFGR